MFPAPPLRLVDLIGSGLVILLSLACLRLSWRAYRSHPQNLVWTYLFWVCVCLAAFAGSRSLGHLLRHGFAMTGREAVWRELAPYSAGVNTFTLIVLSAITLFFGRVWRVCRELAADRAALDQAHGELLRTHETLEERVREGAEALARSEKQMAQADRLAAIGELSAGVAHELNNPLGIILGYTQLMLRQEPSGGQRREDLETIEKHVQNCKTVVEDLLSFSRGSCESRSHFQVNALMESVLGFLRNRAAVGGLKIETDYGSQIPDLWMDEKKIKQVLVNLLLNARDAMGGAGTLRLATEYEPGTDPGTGDGSDADAGTGSRAGRVTIRVRDDGHGIDPQHLSRIFDPFFTTKPTGEGTGLGLAVSYGIVKRHGGDIEVDSRPGEGAEFRVVLPVERRGGHGGAADNPGR
jgi:signal transduction histidine kinase